MPGRSQRSFYLFTLKHTCWMAVVAPTDRLKSARSRCVIECDAACLSFLSFYHIAASDLFIFLFIYVNFDHFYIFVLQIWYLIGTPT